MKKLLFVFLLAFSGVMGTQAQASGSNSVLLILETGLFKIKPAFFDKGFMKSKVAFQLSQFPEAATQPIFVARIDEEKYRLAYLYTVYRIPVDISFGETRVNGFTYNGQLGAMVGILPEGEIVILQPALEKGQHGYQNKGSRPE